MSMPAAKRRRIDAASCALSKPFCSPLKRPPVGSTPVVIQTSSDLVQSDNDNSTKMAEFGKPLLQPMATPSRTKAIKTPLSSRISYPAPNAVPEIAALIKTQLQLERQLRALKGEMDIAEQAQKIELDSERRTPGGAIDGELTKLIQKWRAASRQAAEELFTGVRDRVNRMGGPKAWKEMQERQKEFRSGWDTDPLPSPNSDDEDGQDVEKRDLYAEYDVDIETANEKEARGGNDVSENEGAEEEFTMAMMLRSLNVPLTTIGYDRECQRWAD